eukprot:303815_1
MLSATEQSYFTNQINAIIDNANNVTDLQPLLSHIPLDYVQTMLRQYINTLNSKQIEHTFYQSTPITHILDCDVIQYILSFNVTNEINCVSKSFQQLSQLNQKRQLKLKISQYDTRQQIITDYQLKYAELKEYEKRLSKQIIKYRTQYNHLISVKKKTVSEMNSIINSSYTKLRKIYQQNTKKDKFEKYFNPQSKVMYVPGFNEVFIINNNSQMTLFNAIIKSKIGDKISIDNGTYKWNSRVNIKHKNIQIIGIGDNVIIELNDQMYISEQSNIYFENIKFKALYDERNEEVGWEGFIRLTGESNIWLSKCEFEYDNFIDRDVFPMQLISVCKDCSVYVKDCLFDKCDNAIKTSPFSRNINVINCTFKKCGNVITGKYACIEIEDHRSEGSRWNNDSASVQINGIGNVFVNNMSYCFGAKFISDGEQEDRLNDSYYWFQNFNGKNNCVLKNNVCTGSNGSIDPNKVYRYLQHGYN